MNLKEDQLISRLNAPLLFVRWRADPGAVDDGRPSGVPPDGAAFDGSPVPAERATDRTLVGHHDPEFAAGHSQLHESPALHPGQAGQSSICFFLAYPLDEFRARWDCQVNFRPDFRVGRGSSGSIPTRLTP